MSYGCCSDSITPCAFWSWNGSPCSGTLTCHTRMTPPLADDERAPQVAVSVRVHRRARRVHDLVPGERLSPEVLDHRLAVGGIGGLVLAPCEQYRGGQQCAEPHPVHRVHCVHWLLPCVGDDDNTTTGVSGAPCSASHFSPVSVGTRLILQKRWGSWRSVISPRLFRLATGGHRPRRPYAVAVSELVAAPAAPVPEARLRPRRSPEQCFLGGAEPHSDAVSAPPLFALDLHGQLGLWAIAMPTLGSCASV